MAARSASTPQMAAVSAPTALVFKYCVHLVGSHNHEENEIGSHNNEDNEMLEMLSEEGW